MSDGGLALRPAGQADGALLEQLVTGGGARPASLWASASTTRLDPRRARFVTGWPRPGDIGTVATFDARPVGAAWLRRFAGAELQPGEDGDVPLAAFVVEPAWRCRGIGRRLLIGLIVAAADHGIGAIELTLDATNGPGVRLAASAGFAEVSLQGSTVRMRRHVRPPGPRPPAPGRSSARS